MQSLLEEVLVRAGALGIEDVPNDDHPVKEQVLGWGAEREKYMELSKSKA